jgi:hypothetical protein
MFGLKEEYKMKLSKQAMGSLMMALQKSLLEQTDIVPVLEQLDWESVDGDLFVKNPPAFSLDQVEHDVD